MSSTTSPELELEPPYVARPLAQDDYRKGFVELLGQLTTIGEVTEEAFRVQYQRRAARSEDYHTIVIEDTSSQRIVATATLLLEYKFIRSMGTAGHIEDVVVDYSVRGKNFGRRLVEELTQLAKQHGCYKVILDCSDHNIEFYTKCGFQQMGAQMAVYL
eukprot:jgi/Chlat1/809/Chrsp104S01267